MRLSSLFLPVIVGGVGALDLDVAKTDSITTATKTLADALMSFYKAQGEGSVPGLFGDDGKPIYWWEAGAIWNAMIEYSHLTGDDQYNDLILEGVQHQIGSDYAFMPANQTKNLDNDGQTTWALAALTAEEVGFPKPEDREWIDLAQEVFDILVERWDDETCDGGLRWQIFQFNNGYDYKNTQSNGRFFLLSARLAQITKNQTHLEWAEKSFEWAQDVGFVTDNYTVFDGANAEGDCEDISKLQWTSVHAIYTEGAAIMYNITDGDDDWKESVNGFVESSSVFKVDDVLSEVACEDGGKCNQDQIASKGIALSSYARAALVAPFAKDSLDKVLQATAKGAAESCDGKGEDLACDVSWVGDNDDAESVKDGGISAAFSALEAVQVLLWSEAGAPQGGNATGNSTTNPSATQSGAPSGTGNAAAEGTGAAGSFSVTWELVGFAGLLAVLGLY